MRSGDCLLVCVLVEGLEHRAAQQLLEERGGHAFGALDDLAGLGITQAQRKRAAVEREQLFTSLGIREVDLDRDVDAPRTRRERGLKQVSSVVVSTKRRSASGAAPSIASSRSNRTGLEPGPKLRSSATRSTSSRTITVGWRSRASSAARPIACSARPVRMSLVYPVIRATR